MWILISLIIVLPIILFFATSLTIKFKDDGIVDLNSWHVQLYKRLWCIDWDRLLPKNICNYFWSYLLGYILLPINIFPVLLGIFFKKVREEFDDQVNTFIAGALSWVILIFIPIMISTNTFESPFIFIDYIIHLGCILFSFALAIAIIFGVFALIQKIKSKNKDKVKKENLLFQRIKDWKNKSCTTITYK